MCVAATLGPPPGARNAGPDFPSGTRGARPRAMLADPHDPHPFVLPGGAPHRAIAHLRAVIDHPNIDVGEWTYHSDDAAPEDRAHAIAPYLYPGAPERLVIGRFCAIAQGAEFLTESANHAMGGITTYPFAIFDPVRRAGYAESVSRRRDTVVGHDVWIGRGATVLPGARIGSGAIVGARAVVSGEVPPYAVVAGNPARAVRTRFAEREVAALLALAWWDWPAARIEAALPLLESDDVAALLREFGA